MEQTTGPSQSSVVELENIEEPVYGCAPGENIAPKHMLIDKEIEVFAFSDMFPTRTGAYETTKRETKLLI